MSRGIQLSYDTLNDIRSDTSLVQGMVVYAASLSSLGDGGGSYYKIITKSEITNGTTNYYKMDNGLYAWSIETTQYTSQLRSISKVIDSAEKTLNNLKTMVSNIESNTSSGYSGSSSSDDSSSSSSTSGEINALDESIDNVAEVIGELCDESLTLYSEALQLKNTSMGDMSLIELTPILDSDIDNLARHIGDHEDSLDILAEHIGYLMDYDYIVKNRIKDLEDAVKALKPDFEPAPYPSGKETNIEEEESND